MTILRRQFLVAMGGSALLSPLAAYAQQPGYRIGWLSNDKPADSPFFEAFRSGMRDLGYIEGRNLVIDARWGEGSPQRLDQLAVELVQSKPQIIVTQGGPATFPVVRAKAAMPVVFGFSGDPVEAKVVDSYARPGRNFTGTSYMSFELVGKRMEMLKEVIPGMKRVAIIANPHHPGEQGELRVSTAAAKSLGLMVDYFQVRNDAELESAFTAILKSRCDAIDAFPDAFVMRASGKIAAFSMKNRIPAISGWAQFADRGNLMSYGPNLRDSYRRLAIYVDKILKGAKPADLPIELPTTVEMVINMTTARVIGIKFPQTILVRADKVIE